MPGNKIKSNSFDKVNSSYIKMREKIIMNLLNQIVAKSRLYWWETVQCLTALYWMKYEMKYLVISLKSTTN